MSIPPSGKREYKTKRFNVFFLYLFFWGFYNVNMKIFQQAEWLLDIIHQQKGVVVSVPT